MRAAGFLSESVCAESGGLREASSGGRAGRQLGFRVWEGDEQEAGPQRQHGGPLGDAVQLDAVRQVSVESVCTEWSVSGG